MSLKESHFVACYLPLTTLFAGYAFYYSSSANSILDKSSPPQADCTIAVPKLTGLYPTQLNAGSVGELLLRGCHFPSPASASSDITLEIKAAPGGGDDDNIDGCQVPVEKATEDEDLPASEGGVG